MGKILILFPRNNKEYLELCGALVYKIGHG